MNVSASQTAYTLIGAPPTRTIRVIWAFEEMGLSYNIEPARPHSEEISRVNPSGKVPALRVQDTTGEYEIIDSVAILQFLADRHQELTFKAGSRERAIQDSFTQFACDEIDGTLWQMAKHTFVWPEDLRQFDAIKPGCTRDLDRAFGILEQRLGTNDYVMGTEFTVPDIVITHCCGWAQRSGYELQHPSLIDYLMRCHARAPYQRAMEIRSQYL